MILAANVVTSLSTVTGAFSRKVPGVLSRALNPAREGVCSYHQLAAMGTSENLSVESLTPLGYLTEPPVGLLTLCYCSREGWVSTAPWGLHSQH